MRATLNGQESLVKSGISIFIENTIAAPTGKRTWNSKLARNREYIERGRVGLDIKTKPLGDTIRLFGYKLVLF